MVKIVLTGGKGFLGSRFENYFKGKYKIFTPDIDELDVTDEKKVMDYFNSATRFVMKSYDMLKVA